MKMMCDRGNGWVKVSKDGAIQNEGQINLCLFCAGRDRLETFVTGNRDFKIWDATTSRTQWLIKDWN